MRSESHDTTTTADLDEFMRGGWAPRDRADEPLACVPHTAKRRERLVAQFPGDVLVIPTGHHPVPHVPFRPGRDFAYLTGDHEPDGVLVLTGEDAVLFRGSMSSSYADRTSEFWKGRGWTHAEASTALGLECRPLEDLDGVLAGARARRLGVLGSDAPGDDDLAAAIAEMRLVKDDFEVAQLQDAVETTVRAFHDVVAALDDVVATGERTVEAVFNRRARVDGRGVGYPTIAASGEHATVLHWNRNTGPVVNGDLLLIDAGVENRWLYTADITRTLPVAGRFTPLQREVYEIVHQAQSAAIAAVRPGAAFRDYHLAANEVLAAGLVELGLLPSSEGPFHRRWTLHATGHMLGLDVHDCAAARASLYPDGPLVPGHVLTVEPGLYFRTDDLTVPPELRGIGVRIEDDVLVTADGAQVLSKALPRSADEVEAWISTPHLTERTS